MIRVRASQVFTPQVDDAVAAKKELDAGSEFTEVVAKFSTCPSKEAGGDLGWMPEENAAGLIGQAITEEDEGKILGPIHSPYGYHILKITAIEIEIPEGPFREDTPMNAVNEKFPNAHTLLFEKFHIGLPVAGYKPEETIGSVAKAHNKTVMELLALLNQEYTDQNLASIEGAELKAKLSDPQNNVALLDIREQWERDIAQIEGSQLVTRENCEQILSSINPTSEIVLIDWKGDRNASFQKFLQQRGFKNVKGLEGGINAWAQNIDTSLALYEIDEEDDDYRYEDVFDENP